ncbi:universal stress protein [Streptomyces sp. NPDC006475]|uniref:universal stress protein n=1 Tax=Streptomyces sp. NPDC006475 TaxID=3155719 RepID=UPI0033BCE522
MTRSPTGNRRDTITVGVDGSAESLNAAAWAAREARRRGMALQVVHVDDGPPHPTGLRELDAPAGRERGTLDSAIRALTHGNPSGDIIAGTLTGPPAPALVNAARESVALVVGSRGRTALEGFVVGSVALAVTAKALCPVVLIRAPRPHPYLPRRAAPEPVVVGVDLDHSCGAVLAQAFTAAALREAPLLVVHAWSVPLLTDTSSGIPEPETTKRRQLAAVVGPWLSKYPHTPVTERLVHSTPGHALREAGESAGLLVLGRRTNPAERLGRTLHSVIHHVHCPVFVVPHG